MSGQSLCSQGPKQSRAWQPAALTPTPVLPGTGSRQLSALCLRQPLASACQEAAVSAPPGKVLLALILLVSQPRLSGSAESKAVTLTRGGG